MRRLILLALTLAATVVLVPTVAVADSATHTYVLVMEEPNFGVAANGDQIAVTGEGEFSVNPNGVDATGDFIHADGSGNVLATGTWTATGLINYQSYGCGEVFGITIPPDQCGGAVKMSVTLTPTGTGLKLAGTLTVFCVIGTYVARIFTPSFSASAGISLPPSLASFRIMSLADGHKSGGC